MKNNSICIVATTINNGDFIDDYVNSIKIESLPDTKIIIIPDLKSPKELYEKVELYKKKGVDIVCPNIDEQNDYLKKLGDVSNIIPYNSDNRRNIGYLMAYQSGTEILISIDDDNLPLDKNFLSGHMNALKNKESLKRISTESKWFNICDLLDLDTKNVYPRGYPYYARHIKNQKVSSKLVSTQADINAGLWIKHPDIDAITWLVNPAQSLSFKGESIFIDNDTWSPINTQNTSLVRDVIPAYYFIKMDYPLMNLPIDRYGDIFSGFFAQKCAKHLNKDIRIGSPIANHERNSHNYMKDSSKELLCITILEDLLPWLTEVKLDGNNYKESYLSLSHNIDSQVEKMNGGVWNDATKGYFHQMAYCMRTWISAINQLN